MRRKGLKVSIFGIAAAVLTAGVVLFVVFRADLAASGARHYLASRGFEAATVTVERIGLRETAFAMDLGPGEPAVERLIVSYDPRGILSGRLSGVTIQGLRATVDLAADSPFGRIGRMLEGGGEGTGAPNHPRVILHDAQLTVLGLIDVPLAVTVDGDLDALEAELEIGAHAADGRIETQAKIKGGWKDGAVTATLLEPAIITLPQSAAPFPKILEVAPGRLPLVRFRPTSRGWEGGIAARIADEAERPVAGPLAVEMDVAKEDAAVRFGGTVSWRDQGVPLKGTYDDKGVTLAAGPAVLTFGESLQPADISPLAAAIQADGPLEVSGRFAQGSTGTAKASARLKLDGLTLRTADFGVEKLAGTLDLASLAPLRTLPDQRLSAQKLALAVPLRNIHARFQIENDKNGLAIMVKEAGGEFAEGTVSIGDVRFVPAADHHALDLRIEALSLSRLFEELAIDGLSGEGHLSGILPARFDAHGLSIGDGQLEAGGKGIIRLAIGNTRGLLEGQGEEMGFVVKALENFHYERLRIGVARPPAEDLALSIRLEGHNPEVLEGHPINFNISLSGNPEPILAALKEGRRLSGELLKGVFQGGP